MTNIETLTEFYRYEKLISLSCKSLNLRRTFAYFDEYDVRTSTLSELGSVWLMIVQ